MTEVSQVQMVIQTWVHLMAVVHHSRAQWDLWDQEEILDSEEEVALAFDLLHQATEVHHPLGQEVLVLDLEALHLLTQIGEDHLGWVVQWVLLEW